MGVFIILSQWSIFHIPRVCKGFKMAKITRQSMADATRHKLIMVAHDLFSHKGYPQTSLDTIVTKAQMTKGAVYHHFKNKQQVYAACYEYQARQVAQYIAQTPQTEDAWADALSQCQAFLDFVIKQGKASMPLQEVISVLGYERWIKLDSQHTMGIMLNAVERLQTAKLVKPYPAPLLAQTLYGLLVSSAMSLSAFKPNKQSLQQQKMLVQDLLSGIRLSNEQ